MHSKKSKQKTQVRKMHSTETTRQFAKWLTTTGNTYDSAGEILGVSRFAIECWKKGYHAPHYKHAKKIEKIVGIKAVSWFE